jgi:hypothetical protein
MRGISERHRDAPIDPPLVAMSRDLLQRSMGGVEIVDV